MLARSPSPASFALSLSLSLALSPAIALALAPAAVAPVRAPVRAPAPAPATAPAAARPRAPARASPLSRLLARTFKAYGGLEGLLAVEGIRSAGTVRDGERLGRVERALAPTGRLRAVTTFGGVEHETVVLDGDRAWRDGAEVTGLARSVLLRLEAARLFLPALLARERAALVDRGELRRAGRQLRLVELPFEKEAALLAEIDAGSGRIVRTTARVGRYEIVVTYDRFRRVSGLLFPFHEAIAAPEGLRTVALDRVELVPAGVLRLSAP